MKTKIADVIVPEVFTQYVIQKSEEKSNLINSGIAIQNSELNKLVTAGGRTVNMPYWNDLSGDDEVLSDTTALTPDKITSGKDVAALLIRGRAWSANELAGALAGDDPMAAIANLIATYWSRREQAIMLSILKGIFATTLAGTHVKDISGAAGAASIISPQAVLDAKQLLGDSSDGLTAMAMHSAVYTELQKQNLINSIPAARGEITFPSYLGYRIIVDDGMPVNAGVYNTYLFGAGSFGRGDGVPVSVTPTETDRDSLASDDILINRRAMVLHPFGVKWKDTTVAGATPSNAELALGTNWERVYEAKKIRIVLLKHKLTV